MRRGLPFFPIAAALFLIFPTEVPSAVVQPFRFAVATWNVRSGEGAAGTTLNAPFDMNTANCSDPSRPQNAWGIGFVQQFLAADVQQDPRMVALGLQEAWGTCATVKNITALLQWNAASPERGGVGLVARYGIIGAWDTWQIEFRNVAGAPEDRWIVGGNVCLDRDCIRRAYMWATHLQATIDDEWPQHVERVLDWLSTKPLPHLFMGDMNIWQNNQWSPATNCGAPTANMAAALGEIMQAGYRDTWAATQLGEGWTAALARPGCGPDRNGGAYKRVDYIWTKGLQPVSTMRIGVVPAGTPAPSDHFGLKAEFVTW